MSRSRRGISRASASATLRWLSTLARQSTGLVVTCVGLFGSAACGVHADSLDASELGAKANDTEVEVRAQVQALLREVFPNLTDDEIADASSNLSLDAAVALKLEISNMRAVASSLSKDLADAASASAKQRPSDLASQNDGFPAGLEPLGRSAFYDTAHGEARVDLSGVFNDHDPVMLGIPGTLGSGDISVSIAGAAQTVQVSCAQNEPVDVVFLVDVTGSMTPVIGAVQRSLQKFVTAIVAKGVSGTLGVVTFQDSVGVNVSFQQPLPKSGYERSPFFEPVDIGDATGIAKLQRFIARLEADSGADIPENLGGALDFAQNDVIGLTKSGAPNVIGDGVEDPVGVGTWPKLQHARHIFVALTDAPFHSDSRTASNSSLVSVFKPRPIATILHTLQAGATTVHVSDPSWVDETTEPTGAANEVSVDSDYWAIHTGGLGEDRVAGYSPIDLELLVNATDSGLLDILLDSVVATTCSVHFRAASLAADTTLDLELSHAGQSYAGSLSPLRY